MSKLILEDFMQFKPVGSLNESNGAKYGIPGGFVVQGVLQRAGAKNQIWARHSPRQVKV